MITMDVGRLVWLPKNAPRQDQLERYLTVTGKGYGHFAGSKVRCFEKRGGRLGIPRMLGVTKLQGWLSSWGYKFRYKVHCSDPYLKWPEFDGTLRHEQKAPVADLQEWLSGGRGLWPSFGGCFHSPCGSGKSVVTLYLCTRLHAPVLVLVHKQDLEEQWVEYMRTFVPNALVGRVRGDTLDYEGKHLTVGMMQTLYSRRKSLPSDLFSAFGMVVYDEGHRVSAVTYEAVAKMFRARRRLALSATFRRYDELDCVYQWHIGPIRTRATVSGQGGTYVQVEWREPWDTSAMRVGGRVNMARMVNAISKSFQRSRFIAAECLKAHDAGRKVLVLSGRRKHVTELRGLILAKAAEEGRAVTVGEYVGQMKKEQREASAQCDVIVATYAMMAEGTDIPDIDTLYLATPRGDIEQPLGRIQRVADKKPLVVVDLVDNIGMAEALGRKRQDTLERLGFKPQGAKK